MFYAVDREVIIEKHWRGVTPRSVCDFFWDEVNKVDSKEVISFCINSINKLVLVLGLFFQLGYFSGSLDIKILRD